MELIRRAVRRILKPDSRLFRGGANVLDFLSTMRTDGYGTWCILKDLREGSQGDPLPRSVTLQSLTYPVLIRPGTQDADTIINNVIREEYGQVTPPSPPKWMIDAGAYIGDTSAYFLSKFPDLKVIALEPNPPSYEMAKRNLRPYGERVILLQSGLSSTDGVARFSGDGTGAWIAGAGFEIECTTVLSLLERYQIPRVDILKMDIEGAEEAVFSSQPQAWLSRIDMLIIEIHGPHIRSLISRVLSDSGFSIKKYRSIWYCRSGQRWH